MIFNTPISIVLPTYNRLYSLKTIFFPHLEKQKYSNYELIIIDDCSSDGTDAYLQSREFILDFPNISKKTFFKRNNKNVGAPTTRNIWASYAKWKWILIIEDDIELYDELFFSKFEALSSSLSIKTAVIAPYLEIINLQWYYELPWEDICYIGKFSKEIYLDPTKKIDKYVRTIHWVAFIKRDIYNKLNWQESSSFLGNTFRDESEFYLRLIKAGYKIYYAWLSLECAHRNDLATEWGQKKVNSKNLFSQEIIILKNHYIFLKKHYFFPKLIMIAFFWVRIIKVSSQIFNIPILKKILVKLKI